jgi:hypothetical protein
MSKVKVKLDVNRYSERKKMRGEDMEEELVISCGEESLDMGYYSDKLNEFITFNIESIPKIVDTLLYVHNMITRLNKEEISNAKLQQ